MSVARDFQLIEEVKKRPALWNQNDPEYKGRAVAHTAWHEVSTKLNITEQTAKVKWKYLRDIFLKQLKKYGIPETEDHYPGKWRYFKALFFLLSCYSQNGEIPVKVEMPAKRRRRRHPSEEEADSADDEPNQESCDEDPMEESDAQADGKDAFMHWVPTTNPEQLYMTAHPASGTGSHHKMALPNKLHSDVEDDDVMFLRSLAPYFKKLSPIRKLEVRNKFQDILLVELRNNGTD